MSRPLSGFEYYKQSRFGNRVHFDKVLSETLKLEIPNIFDVGRHLDLYETHQNTQHPSKLYRLFIYRNSPYPRNLSMRRTQIFLIWYSQSLRQLVN
jgi:hypothetical protein